MVSEMLRSARCQVGEKCLELPCDYDVAILSKSKSSISHERETLEKNSNTVNSCHARYSRRSSRLLSLSQV
jgi:hypothetical protein